MRERIRTDAYAALPIHAALDEISARGEARRAAARDPFIRGLKPATYDWLTEAERSACSKLLALIRPKGSDEARADVERKRTIRRQRDNVLHGIP